MAIRSAVQLHDLPLSELREWLAQRWYRAGDLLVPKSVTADEMEDGTISNRLLDADTSMRRFPTAVVTALPGSPTNGQTCLLNPSGWTMAGTAEVRADVLWLLEYRASSSRWHFLGGDPLVATVNTPEARNNVAYGALATGGPSITPAITGDFKVQCGTTIFTLLAPNTGGYMSYSVGATAADDADACVWINGAATAAGASVVSPIRRKTITGGNAFVSNYRNSVATANLGFSNRWLSIEPIRLG